MLTAIVDMYCHDIGKGGDVSEGAIFTYISHQLTSETHSDVDYEMDIVHGWSMLWNEGNYIRRVGVCKQ